MQDAPHFRGCLAGKFAPFPLENFKSQHRHARPKSASHLLATLHGTNLLRRSIVLEAAPTTLEMPAQDQTVVCRSTNTASRSSATSPQRDLPVRLGDATPHGTGRSHTHTHKLTSHQPTHRYHHHIQVHSYTKARQLGILPGSRSVAKRGIERIHAALVRALCLIEGCLPVSHLNPGMHHFTHYAQYTKTHGILLHYWMMAFERYLCVSELI